MLLIFGLSTLILASVSLADQSDTCPEGYTQIGGDRCFLYLSDSFTFYQAHTVCDIVDGHIVSITSQADQDKVASFLNGKGATSVWLGATNLQGAYIYLKSKFNFSYVHWAMGHPKNIVGSTYSHCIKLRPDANKDWKWESGSCLYTHGQTVNLLCETRLDKNHV